MRFFDVEVYGLWVLVIGVLEGIGCVFVVEFVVEGVFVVLVVCCGEWFQEFVSELC